MGVKCTGASAARFPGLIFESSVEDGGKQPSCAVTKTVSRHRATVINTSQVTYSVSVDYACDQKSLHYRDKDPQDADSSKTTGTFTATWRWNGKQRSYGEVDIVARAGKRATDVDVSVDMTCDAATYASIGPFRVDLKVDADGT